MSALVPRLVGFDYRFAFAPLGSFASFHSLTATPGQSHQIRRPAAGVALHVEGEARAELALFELASSLAAVGAGLKSDFVRRHTLAAARRFDLCRVFAAAGRNIRVPLELFLRPTRDLEVSLGHRSHDAYRWP